MHIKLAHVRNLAKGFGSIETKALICVAAMMEEITEEIIHKCVGLITRSAVDNEEIQSSHIRFTVHPDDVNIILKRIVRVQDVNDMAERHPLFQHRKKDVSTEVAAALQKNSVQAVKKKREVIKATKRAVEKHNNTDLLTPDETLMFMVQAGRCRFFPGSILTRFLQNPNKNRKNQPGNQILCRK
ncbi:MAG: hypothetical protein R6U97_09430 [Desulfosalsimonas sp.]